MTLSANEILNRNPLFRCFSAHELGALLATTTTKRIERGCSVAGAESAQPLVVVGFGLLRTMIPMSTGSDIALRLHGPGELANDTQLLDPQANRALSVIASRDSIVALVDRHKLLEIVSDNATAALALARSCARGAGDAYRRMVDVRFSVDVRTAVTLLRLADSYGDEMENGDTLITLPMNRTELAGCVGSTPESVTRTLAPWRNEGVLTVEDNNTITLHNRRRLETIGADLLAAYAG